MSASANDESPPDRPVNLDDIYCLSRIMLTDVRGLHALDLLLQEPVRPGRGQWTILLGDNGVGKTTILRALALALAPADVPPLILGRTGATSPTVRTGTKAGVVQVGVPGEEEVTALHIEPTQGGERLKKRTYANVSMPFLVAYGSRRGSGLVGSVRGADFSSAAAVETLFDEGANIIQPDEWLKGWQLAALQNPESSDARFFGAIRETLCRLLPGVQQIHVTREAVELEGPEIGRVPLGTLSDGYRTTMGWILDMIARWVEEAKRRGILVDESFPEKMTGVAIVDEIDLHLHPRWQRDVIKMVRGHFKRMSFVVTTHNPLTLLGAEPGEIYVLRRADAGEVEVVQRDLPPGAGVEQILTGDWFGLTSTLDDETLAKLAEHRRLINERGMDAPESKDLEEELRRRLGSYADTSVERLAQQAAAKVLGDDARSLTPDERRAARAKIADMIREPAPVKRPRPPEKPKTATVKPKTRPRRSAG
jgi:hypothetical protein